jgi:hypothetical protein
VFNVRRGEHRYQITVPYSGLDGWSAITPVWNVIASVDEAIRALGIRSEQGTLPESGVVGSWSKWLAFVCPGLSGEVERLRFIAQSVHDWYSSQPRAGNDPDGTPWVRVPVDADEWAANTAKAIRTVAFDVDRHDVSAQSDVEAATCKGISPLLGRFTQSQLCQRAGISPTLFVTIRTEAGVPGGRSGDTTFTYGAGALRKMIAAASAGRSKARRKAATEWQALIDEASVGLP